MNNFLVNGAAIPEPSTYTWSLADLSSEQSGRDLTGQMSKDIVSQKRTLALSWNFLDFEKASSLLKAVNGTPYFSVTYPDAMDGDWETRTFYVGDRAASCYTLNPDLGCYGWTGISFQFIER